MLIEFTVTNFRSIKEAQTLSLTKGVGDELEETNCFSTDSVGKLQLLHSAAIYGANSAGKSNVIKALKAMETIVLKSASTQDGDEISVTPFLFDETSSEEPSEFECIFLSKGVRYQYGFTTTSKQILEEWLIAYPKGRAQHWFSRLYDKDKEAHVYKFGDSLSGQKSVWQQATRSNALLLSTAIQLNSEQLKPVFNWFKDRLRITRNGDWGPSFTTSLCTKGEEKNRVLSFLKSPACFNLLSCPGSFGLPSNSQTCYYLY